MTNFYCRYADNTPLLVKPADIPHIRNLFNMIKTYISQAVLKIKYCPIWTCNLPKEHQHSPIC